MTALQQLKQKIKADCEEALRHIEWLEAYEKRMPGNGQQVMTEIDSAAQSLPIAPAADPESLINKRSLIREVVESARGEFSVNEIMAFWTQRHPSVELSRKYLLHVLYRMEQNKFIRITRKGTAGNPNHYVLSNLSAVKSNEKAEVS